MPRPDNELTPEMERELEALDRALADEPVGDPDLADLAMLVEAVQQDAPKMSPTFAAEMEEKIEAGFPREKRSFFGGFTLPKLNVMLPATGAMAALLIALVVVLGGSNGSDDDAATNFAAAPAESVQRESVDGGGAVADDEAPAPAASAAPEPDAKALRRSSELAPAQDLAGATQQQSGSQGYAGGDPNNGLAPNAKNRKVERNAELVIGTRPDSVQSVANDVVRKTADFKGIVVSSNISSGKEGGTASFDLRIPTAKLDEALRAYSELGDVVRRDQGLTDITGSFVSTQDRLSDARAERKAILRALGKASTQQRIDSLRARLRIVRGTIGRLNGEMNALRRRADLATVSLTVQSDPAAASNDDDNGGAWTPGDAFDDGMRVLEVAAGIGLILVAIAIPLALLGIPALLGARTARRRRREQALDATA